MGAPALPPLHLLQGCGHLFLPPVSEMGHGGLGNLGNLDLGPLARINGLGSVSNHLGQLGQLGQTLGPLGHLAALQLHACRPIQTSTDCNSNTLGSYNSMTSPSEISINSPLSNHLRSSMTSNGTVIGKRPRGEKRPIPDEHKDDKYYERRKRNNQAAKKSRDARKIREDQIALRAAILEHENGILRAQLIAMREEMRTLRRLVLTRPTSHSNIISEQCLND